MIRPIPVYARCLLTFLLAMLSSPTWADEPTGAELKFFENKIRPVLVQQCYGCHSQQASESDRLEAGLLLDSREGIRKGGESGPAVVPGDVDASLLVSAIRHDSFKMPPDTKLGDEVIEDFVKWVKMGAPDPRRRGSPAVKSMEGIDLAEGRQFWAFQPLRTVEPQPVRDVCWVRNDVDRYLLAKLEENGLTPSSEATRRVLIRRVYFDLWGLPPTPEAVRAFLADQSPNAYERLVDRLLAGQHYGERWARHWLDLARFAESNGYAFDKDRPSAFHYRDFVIRALNQDMPYDQFVRLQIAGDLLEPNSYEAQAATGFLAAGPFTSQQTQKERERSRYEQLDDIVGTIGTSLLGLTVGCARCHDHKFDPLPTRDYYRLTACFAATGFQDYDYDPDPMGTKAALDKFNQAHQPLVDARTEFERDVLPQRLDEWLQTNEDPPPRETLGNWQVIGPFAAENFKKAYDTAFDPEREIKLDKTYGERKWTPQPTWSDGKIHNTLKGDNSANYLYRTIDVTNKGPLEVSFGRDDAIKVWLNRKLVLAKEVMGGVAADQDKVSLPLKAGRNELLVKIVNAGGPSGFYFQSRPAIPKNIQGILDLAADKRNKQQQQQLLKWFAPRDEDWVALNQAEQEHLKQKPQPKITKVFAARKNGATYNFGADTRKVYFLARGNSNAKQGLASPGFLRVLTANEASEGQWLSPASGATSTSPTAANLPPRIALADWLTDERHGAGNLLARVIVNRLWQHHFGRGIVATPSDFGSQGTPPSHPELLDDLSTKLIQGGWRLKPLHKLIMMSAAYRQSGEMHPNAMRVDPNNRLWSRRPAMRLEAEVIRDSLLSVSGTLDATMYGKGSLDQASPRRSVYLTVKRSNLVPLLQLFDAPDAIQSIGARDLTTVPPQALAMMNSPLVRRFAEQFARRVRPNGEVPLEQVVDDAYAVALSRPPGAPERERMLRFIDAQAASYGGDAEGTERAVADFCQTILCLNEFIFID